MVLPQLSLVLGGARSGKSNFAESLVLGAGGQAVYLATATAGDDEMRARIEYHRLRRKSGGWVLLEEPTDVAGRLSERKSGEVLLLDCATLWLSNQMACGAEIPAETARLLAAMRACAARVVVVSNETGGGIVPENRLARQFRDEQGRLNQALAAQADLVVAVMAGLPLVLKGQLPQ